MYVSFPADMAQRKDHPVNLTYLKVQLKGYEETHKFIFHTNEIYMRYNQDHRNFFNNPYEL